MKEDLSDAPRKRKCEKCSRRINVGNFELHEMKCKPKEPKPTASRSALQEKLKQSKREKEEKKSEEQAVVERFPCYMCSYEQSYAELDSHPTRCPNREINCNYCSLKYPVSIMASHKDVCTQRPRTPFVPVPVRNQIFSASSPPASRDSSVQRIHTAHLNSRAHLNATININTAVRQESRTRPLIGPPASHFIACTNIFAAGRAPPSSDPVERQLMRARERIAQDLTERNRRETQALHNIDQRISNIHAETRRILSSQFSNDSSHSLPRQDRPDASEVDSDNELFEIPRRSELLAIREAANERRIIQQLESIRQRALIHQLANRHLKKKEEGLTKAEIALIADKRFSPKEKGEEECCSICCVEFHKEEKVKDLKCNHNFHSKCISDWLKINKSCPLCKADLSLNIPRKLERKVEEQKKVPFARFVQLMQASGDEGESSQAQDE